MPTQIGIFAKHWTPGRAKTRLAATVGNAIAADVARLFVQTLLRRLDDVADVRVVGFAPPEKRDLIAATAGKAWRLRPQCEGDLGERMRHYFATAFEQGADRVVLLGADSPNLPLATLNVAFAELEACDLVLSPTDDGGYCLIGARNEPPPVLDAMPWSEESLWDATTERLDQLGWHHGKQWRALPAWYDVDTGADLDRLRGDLSAVVDDAPLMRLRDELDRLLPVDG